MDRDVGHRDPVSRRGGRMELEAGARAPGFATWDRICKLYGWPQTFASGVGRRRMKTIGNVVWLLLAGLWLALGYVIAACLLAITIIGLPFAKQSVKLAGYALWPFGRRLVKVPERNVGISVVGNILWVVLAGWWLALSHLLTGALLCLTIIGIPLGIADIKMAGAALAPFGKQVVRSRDLTFG